MIGYKVRNSAVVCVEIFFCGVAGLRAYVVIHNQSSMFFLQDLVSGNALATACSLSGKEDLMLVLH